MTFKHHTATTSIALLMLAGCAASPPPAPTYAAPEGYEVKPAIMAAMSREKQSGPSAEETLPEEGLNGTNFYATAAAQARESRNDQLDSNISQMIEPKILHCEWQNFAPGQIENRRQPPATAAPQAAYLCEFIARYRVSWGVSAAKGKGYFYKSEDKWVFDGEAVHGFVDEKDLT